MKAAGPAAHRLVGAPPAGVRLVLVFGKDPGLVRDGVERLIASWNRSLSEPAETHTLTEDDVLAEKGRLAELLQARPMFGGAPIVRVRLSSEKASRVIVPTVESFDDPTRQPEGFLVVEAGDLGTKSKLRMTFEAAATAQAVLFYSDSEADIAALFESLIKKDDASITAEALAALSAAIGTRRDLALQEAEKFGLYGIGLGRPIDLNDLDALGIGESASDVFGLVDAVFLGQPRRFDRLANRYLEAGGAPVSLLRALALEARRVLLAHSLLVEGLDEATIGSRLKPRIFPGQWAHFRGRLKRTPAGLAALFIDRLYEAEAMCKQTGMRADLIAHEAGLAIATRLQGRG